MTAVLVLFAVALALALLACPPLIRRLQQARMGQIIREEAPAAHRGKAGTPTAGGLVFLPIAALLYLVADRSLAGGLVLLGLLSGAALGLFDDLAKFRGGRLGVRARVKFPFQVLIGAILGYLALRWGFQRQAVPFGGAPALGAWLIPVAVVAFVSGSNAFNLTDGSDGLAAGAGALVFATLAVLAVAAGRPSAALMPAVLSGALLGFLVYNRHPARIFMGDTGSLGLGTAMVAAAMVGGVLWYLPLLAVVFVAETLSVIVQVAGFKTTGRRVLKLSPLHHHFQLSGWSENLVAASAWAVTLAASLITLVVARGSSLT